MRDHDAARELPFQDLIDADFPYDQDEKALSIIKDARSISANATYIVLYEICCLPFPNVASKERQRELVRVWADGFEHPLKASMLRCAEHVIVGTALPLPDALAMIEEVGRFEGQRAALALVCFYPGADEIWDGETINASDRIRRLWDAAGA